MRAMTYRGPGRVRVEEKPIPSIEHPNDAIVRVTCAAICGSDLHLYHGMMPDLRVGIRLAMSLSVRCTRSARRSSTCSPGTA